MTAGRVNFALSSDRAGEVRTYSWAVGLRLGYERDLGTARGDEAAKPYKAALALTFDLGAVSDRSAGTRTTSPDLIDLDAKILRQGGTRGGTFLALTFTSDHDWQPAVLGLGYGYRYRASDALTIETALQATKDVASGAQERIGYRLATNYQRGLNERLRLRAEARAQGAFGTSREDQRFLEASLFYSLSGNFGLTARQRLETPLNERNPRSTTQLLLAYDLR